MQASYRFYERDYSQEMALHLQFLSELYDENLYRVAHDRWRGNFVHLFQGYRLEQLQAVKGLVQELIDLKQTFIGSEEEKQEEEAQAVLALKNLRTTQSKVVEYPDHLESDIFSPNTSSESMKGSLQQTHGKLQEDHAETAGAATATAIIPEASATFMPSQFPSSGTSSGMGIGIGMGSKSEEKMVTDEPGPSKQLTVVSSTSSPATQSGQKDSFLAKNSTGTEGTQLEAGQNAQQQEQQPHEADGSGELRILNPHKLYELGQTASCDGELGAHTSDSNDSNDSDSSDIDLGGNDINPNYPKYLVGGGKCFISRKYRSPRKKCAPQEHSSYGLSLDSPKHWSANHSIPQSFDEKEQASTSIWSEVKTPVTTQKSYLFSQTSPVNKRKRMSSKPKEETGSLGSFPTSSKHAVGSKAQPRRWTKEEDDALRVAVHNHQEKNWKAIASQVPGRNHTQCLQRWTKVLAPGLVKGHWSLEEDELLRKLVTNDKKHWGDVAAKIPGRTSKQCRERWHNHLDPSIVRGAYTAEEDRIIIEAQARLGNRWSVIASMLPGRTEDAVKIRWKSYCRTLKSKKSRQKVTEEMEAEPTSSPKPVPVPPKLRTKQEKTDLHQLKRMKKRPKCCNK